MRLEEWLLCGLSRTKQYILSLITLGIATWAYLNDWIWYWGWFFGFILLGWSCFGPQKSETDHSDVE